MVEAGPVDEDAVYPCPAVCGAAFCSLACVLKHRDRFAGKRPPLSHAVALQGQIEVQPPYLHFGNDMFTEWGRRELKILMEDPDLVAEHWAPECNLFLEGEGPDKSLLRTDGQFKGRNQFETIGM